MAVGQLWVEDCDGLTDLHGLEGLRGLERLHTVGENFTVQFCESLVYMAGLESLTYVGATFSLREGDVVIQYN